MNDYYVYVTGSGLQELARRSSPDYVLTLPYPPVADMKLQIGDDWYNVLKVVICTSATGGYSRTKLVVFHITP